MAVRVMFGNVYEFATVNGITHMAVDGNYISSCRASGSEERDIGILMLGYVE